MNAPANIVAVSRAEANVANMVKILLHLCRAPPSGSRDINNAGAVPIGKSRYVSMHSRQRPWSDLRQYAASWEFLPTVAGHRACKVSVTGQGGQLDVVFPPSGCMTWPVM
jgi:hypothetical protein